MRARTIVNSAGGRGHAMEPEEWRAQSIDGIGGMTFFSFVFIKWDIEFAFHKRKKYHNLGSFSDLSYLKIGLISVYWIYECNKVRNWNKSLPDSRVMSAISWMKNEEEETWWFGTTRCGVGWTCDSIPS